MALIIDWYDIGCTYCRCGGKIVGGDSKLLQTFVGYEVVGWGQNSCIWLAVCKRDTLIWVLQGKKAKYVIVSCRNCYCGLIQCCIGNKRYVWKDENNVMMLVEDICCSICYDSFVDEWSFDLNMIWGGLRWAANAIDWLMSWVVMSGWHVNWKYIRMLMMMVCMLLKLSSSYFGIWFESGCGMLPQ